MKHTETVVIDGISIPKQIGHKYRPVKVYPLSFLLTERALGHRRLKVFANKGLRCIVPDCKCEGVYVIEGIDNANKRHIDIYTIDFKLMTVDHVLPKALGGSWRLDNLNPMCCTHNQAKGKRLLHMIRN